MNPKTGNDYVAQACFRTMEYVASELDRANQVIEEVQQRDDSCEFTKGYVQALVAVRVRFETKLQETL